MIHPKQPFSDYIIFVDESGTPTLVNIEKDYPIFALVFCLVEKNHYADFIQPAIKKLKFEFFGHDMAVLHANTIRKPSGEFSFLQIPELRERFLYRLNEIITKADIHLITYVVNRETLKQGHPNPPDPYHMALHACLEQTSLFLEERNQIGKLAHIIAESRGKKEDDNLYAEFQRIMGQEFNAGKTPTYRPENIYFELKFAEKKINSAGLQLSDLAGHPIGRHIISPDKSNQGFDIIKTKIWKQIWTFP